MEKEIQKDIVKIIGRISKAGKEYFQTAIPVEGQEENKFIPVFFKTGVEKLTYKTMERKVDKRGVAYTLYELDRRNVFFPVEEDGLINKAIIMK